ncbi:MAG: 30S ribosomal protein S9 [Phycisphaerales bacterium]|nr:30S ribosomal protein S9 [Phycisphaerales bacterium]
MSDAVSIAARKVQGQGRRKQAHGAYLGTGRRKTSVARVRIKNGSGKILINDRDIGVYFTEIQDRETVLAPLKSTNTVTGWDVFARVEGGGHTGQAGAVRLGIARALLRADTGYEAVLRDNGYLTRDAREVERKKPGRRKARRSFQFSKR